MPKAPLKVFDTQAAIGEYLAPVILDGIEKARTSGRAFLLGCPTGRTPRPIYAAIARRVAAKRPDLGHLALVMMDEYLARTGSGFVYASSTKPWTCHHFVDMEILGPWNRALKESKRLRRDAIWFPDPRDPAAYDAKIADAGGVDFFILASGASDGHVAFNPPGSPRDSRTRIIELSQETRRDNLLTFPEFGTLEQVPTHGVSVGIETIASAKAKAMIVWGAGKRVTLDRILSADRYEPNWPATVIHENTGGEIVADRDAAAHIQDRTSS